MYNKLKYEQSTDADIKDEGQAMTDEELKLLVQSNALAISGLSQRIDSNSRAIEAMIEQRATDRLNQEARAIEHEQRIARLEDLAASLTRIEDAQNRMLSSIDEDRPTVLRKLTTIENKLDRILENQ